MTSELAIILMLPTLVYSLKLLKYPLELTYSTSRSFAYQLEWNRSVEPMHLAAFNKHALGGKIRINPTVIIHERCVVVRTISGYYS